MAVSAKNKLIRLVSDKLLHSVALILSFLIFAVACWTLRFATVGTFVIYIVEHPHKLTFYYLPHQQGIKLYSVAS